MKVLLFTHKIDIDGMGCAVLAKLAFGDCKIEYCETFEVNARVKNYVESGEIYNYDKIFITDICLKQPYIDEIDKNKDVSSKLQILDHHITEINEGNDKYSFAFIKVEDEKGKCSGTSLFYEYLKDKNILKGKQSISQFVELTRRYDTWEWKNVYNDEKANYLNILFTLWGVDRYVEHFKDILIRCENLEFSSDELQSIHQYILKVNQTCREYLKNMRVKDYGGLKAGIVEIQNDYRNLLSQYIRDNKIDIDFVVMKILDRGTVSFRTIRSGVDVGKIAEKFGGGGHKEASSCTVNPQISEFLEK